MDHLMAAGGGSLRGAAHDFAVEHHAVVAGLDTVFYSLDIDSARPS